MRDVMLALLVAAAPWNVAAQTVAAQAVAPQTVAPADAGAIAGSPEIGASAEAGGGNGDRPEGAGDASSARRAAEATGAQAAAEAVGSETSRGAEGVPAASGDSDSADRAGGGRAAEGSSAEAAAADGAQQPAGSVQAADGEQVAEPTDEALAFAGRFADDHLSGMLSRIGAGSEALRALARFDGPAVAAVFDARIDAAVARHRDAWTRNLALAWTPLLTNAQMASLAAEGAQSPDAESYLAGRDAAAAAMGRLSQDLFADILAEVVAATVEQLLPQEVPAK